MYHVLKVELVVKNKQRKIGVKTKRIEPNRTKITEPEVKKGGSLRSSLPIGACAL
jgi:hypothetical protein